MDPISNDFVLQIVILVMLIKVIYNDQVKAMSTVIKLAYKCTSNKAGCPSYNYHVTMIIRSDPFLMYEGSFFCEFGNIFRQSSTKTASSRAYIKRLMSSLLRRRVPRMVMGSAVYSMGSEAYTSMTVSGPAPPQKKQRLYG